MTHKMQSLLVLQVCSTSESLPAGRRGMATNSTDVFNIVSTLLAPDALLEAHDLAHDLELYINTFA